MRIIAGQARGRRLKAPAGRDTRPTGDRVKQTLFDILAPRLPGCRFLDLFAGSGAIGLEAVSRGAEAVVLVDQARPAVEAARENVAALDASDTVLVVQQAVGAALRNLKGGEPFDVVFLDPPYDSPLYEDVLEVVPGVLAEDGLVVAEHFHKRELPATIGPLVLTRAVRVGDHRLSFFRRGEP
jgi:16S rRNA (guanine966-N2)-methyltransferase